MRFQSLFPFWTKSLSDTAQYYETDLENGLDVNEAATRLQEFGANEIPKPKRPSLILLFLRQFASPLIWLLIIAALIAAILGEWIQTGVILAIVILNAIVSFVQEFRAEKSFEALRNLFVPKTKVIRGGNLLEIFSSELVPGDIVSLESGDRVPADGRVIYLAQLALGEAPLTGESVAVYKSLDPIEDEKASLGDRKNGVFLGTEVVSGKGKFLVTSTGANTELGKIALFLEHQKEKMTPLQARLGKLSHSLIYLCLSLVFILFFLGIWKGLPWPEMLLISISLAVAAVPEGLPAIVTIALAVGVEKLAKKNALIRRLSSVETLGCTSVICSDKTGTLTQNEMVVRKIWAGESLFTVEGIGYVPKGDFLLQGKKIDPNHYPDLKLALEMGLLSNSAELYEMENQWKIHGDPTEAALLVAGAKGGLWKKDLEKKFPMISENPFDSDRKRMSILRQGGRLYVKGAPDILLNLSKEIHCQGKISPLSDEMRSKIHEEMDSLGDQGLRLLALAYRDIQGEGDSSLEKDLVFAGFAAMIDPPRSDVKEAIGKCIEANILPLMITGDHKRTAIAIAKEIGLMREGSIALEGKEISQMGDLEFEEKVLRTSVFARASAEDKMKIIAAFKKNGKVVAMTGDGVNDAPAIKQADIGISMGITGTDVTKGASDMILLDDSFSTIVDAVEEGRTIFDNIQKFVFFLLSANLAEVFAVFFGVIIGFAAFGESHAVPLLPVQILWINLVTDGLPGVALAFDPIAPGTMKREPRRGEDPFLTLRQGVQLVLIGVVLAFFTLVAAKIGFQESIAKGQTMAFTALVVFELILVWLIRWPLLPQTNWKLIGAVIISMGLQLSVIYIPSLQMAFKTVPLSMGSWGRLIGLGVLAGILSLCILKFPFRRKR